MDTPPRPDPVTPSRRDADVAALVRAGVAADVIYAALWPGGASAAPMTFDSFIVVVQALEVDAITATPPERLDEEGEYVVADLLISRRRIMKNITDGVDVDTEGNFDASVHNALCKNASEYVKYMESRQNRQVHLLNLRVAREKARLELMDLHNATSRPATRN